MNDEVLEDPGRAYCNRCCNDTKHDVLAEFSYHREEQLTSSEREALAMCMSLAEEQAFHESHYKPNWGGRHELIQCRGCESVSYRHVFWHSEWGRESYFHLYPPRVARRRPEWIDRLGDREAKELIDEIYSALQNNSKRLALMGARCMLDLLLNSMVGDIGGFERKLSEAVNAGHLSARDEQFLQAALHAGHAAAHRNYRPSDDDLGRVLDIVEHLVEGLLIVPNSAAQVRASTPTRRAGNSTP